MANHLKSFGLFFALLANVSSAQTLTVCEVLDHLSDLNGKEIRVRGAWSWGDTGEFLSASPQCNHPVKRDGWVWLNSISIDTPGIQFLELSSKADELKRNNPSWKIMVTFTGVIRTKDHFKMSRNSNLPIDFNYCVAAMSFSKAEELEAAPFGPGEKVRFLQEGLHPYPVKDPVKARK